MLGQCHKHLRYGERAIVYQQLKAQHISLNVLVTVMQQLRKQ